LLLLLVVVIVDEFSRWPMAYLLRSLSAKAVCDAFFASVHDVFPAEGD
jgi:hypothetical protein